MSACVCARAFVCTRGKDERCGESLRSLTTSVTANSAFWLLTLIPEISAKAGKKFFSCTVKPTCVGDFYNRSVKYSVCAHVCVDRDRERERG